MKIFRRIVVLFLLVMVGRNICGCNAFTANENSKVEDELRAHATENGYATFIDYMEKEMDEEDYEEVSKLLKEKRINQGLQTLKYSSVSGNDNYCYINGTYTIPYNVRLTVLWSTNIDVDIYNENFYCNRHYAVSDIDKEAYLLVGSSEFGYRMVRIVSDIYESIELDVDYTREGFELMCNITESRKEKLLANLPDFPDITEELLSSLYANEYDYECIFEYAKQLPDTENEELPEKNQFSDGIVTIQMDEMSRDDYYIYENGVYTINPNYTSFVKWAQNLEKVIDTEASEIKYTVINAEEDAYLLLGNQNGFVLVRFAAN